MPVPMGSQFVDVDFQQAIPSGQLMGCIHEPQNEMFAAAPAKPFSSYKPLFPRSEWKERADLINPRLRKFVRNRKNQGQEGSCFPPGTLVTMASGEVRPIEDVRGLEKVFTAEGNVGEVRQLNVRPYIGQLVNVQLHGNNLVRCTPEHPVLTKRGYVQAGDLLASDYVAIPRIRPEVVSSIQTAAYMPARHRCINETRQKKFNAPVGRTETTVTIAKVPDVISLDEKFGRIIGLFLAEGNVDQQKIVWTFNIDEVDTLVAELQSLLLEVLGVETKLRIAGTHHTAKVEMYGSLWARLFEGLCSTGSGQKQLCTELASGSPAFLRAVFNGWMAGDGHRGQRRDCGVTVSRKLGVQMFQIGTQLGMMPALHRSVPKLSKGVKSRLPRYEVSFGSGDDASGADDNYRRTQDATHCWRKVRLLVLEDYNGPVYNIHVHGDESYIADGVGVHNCVFNSAAGQWQFAAAQQFGWDTDFVILSAIIGYSIYGSSPGSGSMVSDSIKYYMETGGIPESGHGYTYKHQFKATGFYDARKWRAENPDWKDTAKDFLALEYYTVQSVEEWATALLSGHPITKGRSGHCIYDFIWDYDANGRWHAGYANSWGDWGDKCNDVVGNCVGWDSEGSIANQYGYALVGVKIRDEVLKRIKAVSQPTLAL